MDEMIKRTTRHEVSVMRQGSRVLVAGGTTFDFTAEEVADLERRRPPALRKDAPAPVAEIEPAHPIAEVQPAAHEAE